MRAIYEQEQFKQITNRMVIFVKDEHLANSLQ